MAKSTFVLLLSCILVAAKGISQNNAALELDEEADFTSKWIQIAHEIAADPELRADYERRVEEAKNRDFVFGPPTFNCDTNIQKEPAETVHELGPTDVRVLAAMGDSVTAGFGVGAESLLEVANQNRGESWSIGGQKSLDDGVITLSNVMRKFNPDIRGHSLCTSGRLSRHGWLNVAMGGATNKNMPSQAQEIIDICSADERIDNAKDWKVITLLVGGNDLCASCYNDDFNATNYRGRIEEALDLFHDQLPRAFVNIVPMFDITPLRNFSEGIACAFIQPFACRCGILDEYRPDARATQLAYYEELKELVDSGKYDTRNDFTVAIQPMFVDLIPPLDPDTGFYDKTFLSHDCFHPSLKAHQAFAYALWNTMLIPYDEKPRDWDPHEQDPTFYCPTEDNPYFATRLNGATSKRKRQNKEKSANRILHHNKS